MLYTKYEISRPYGFRKTFEIWICETFFWPCDLLAGTILEILLQGHPKSFMYKCIVLPNWIKPLGVVKSILLI